MDSVVSRMPWEVLFFGLAAGTALYHKLRNQQKAKESVEIVQYSGTCHCKKVRFHVQAPAHLTVWKCNCSVCIMKQNLHFIVPTSKFFLISGKDDLQLYTFNTHTAKHYFCKHCGVQSFYVS